MEVLLIVINKEELFEKVISILVEAGVEGATILESQGLGQFLAHEVPIFAGLRQLLGEKKVLNKTVLAVLDDPQTFPRFRKLLRQEDIDFTKPEVGLVVTVPVNEFIKSKEHFD